MSFGWLGSTALGSDRLGCSSRHVCLSPSVCNQWSSYACPSCGNSRSPRAVSRKAQAQPWLNATPAHGPEAKATLRARSKVEGWGSTLYHEGAMTEQEAGRREKLGLTMQPATATDMQKERFHILRSRFVAFLIRGRIHNLGPTSLPGNN